MSTNNNGFLASAQTQSGIAKLIGTIPPNLDMVTLDVLVANTTAEDRAVTVYVTSNDTPEIKDVVVPGRVCEGNNSTIVTQLIVSSGENVFVKTDTDLMAVRIGILSSYSESA